MEPGPYLRSVPKMFEHIRQTCGDEVELLHDIHERVPPVDAILMIKQLEPYRPFFIEDPFHRSRTATSRCSAGRPACRSPWRAGSTSPHEWVGLDQRTADRFHPRAHLASGWPDARPEDRGPWPNGSACGAHARPGDVSPVGHAANAHLDLAISNFGIQEAVNFSQELQEIFPGCPRIENGYMYVNEAPGFGVTSTSSWPPRPAPRPAARACGTRCDEETEAKSGRSRGKDLRSTCLLCSQRRARLRRKVAVRGDSRRRARSSSWARTCDSAWTGYSESITRVESPRAVVLRIDEDDCRSNVIRVPKRSSQGIQ